MIIAGKEIRIRRAPRGDWETYNPVLANGEPGLVLSEDEQEGVEIRIGDGESAWLDLPVASSEAVLTLLKDAF